MKATILLTTMLFLFSAPAPDSKSISEFSGGFFADTNEHGLMAAELISDRQRATELATPVEKSFTKSGPDTAKQAKADSSLEPGKND